MKANYSFNAELISNRKFTASQIEKIKAEIESKEDYLQFYQIFSESLDINFNGYLEIYVEDFPFDLDLSPDIEDMIGEIDTIIPGGWSNDSKIEFQSIVPALTYVWYKDGKEWKEIARNSDRDDFFSSSWEEEDPENYSSGVGYSDYDDESEW